MLPTVSRQAPECTLDKIRYTKNVKQKTLHYLLNVLLVFKKITKNMSWSWELFLGIYVPMYIVFIGQVKSKQNTLHRALIFNLARI